MPKGFVNFYVVAAIAFAAVLAYGGYQYQRAEAAGARAEQAESRAAALTQALASSEEANEALRIAAEQLDLALVERDRRARALQETKRKIESELNALKETLGTEDRACMDRAMPDAILERLRNP